MKSILFYGDSNTYGYDPRGPIAGRYPTEDIWTKILEKKMKHDWKITANGISGRTLPGSDFERNILAIAIKRAMPLDVFALMLGTNDYLNMPEPDLSAVKEKLEQTIDFILQIPEVQTQNTKILLLAPPYLKVAQDPELRAYDTSAGQMSQIYKEVAEKKGLLLADVGAWNLDITFDGVHLSAEGNHQLAEKMEQELGSIEALI